MILLRMKKERERIAQEVDSQTQTSSPGGTDGRGGSGWSGKLSALLHVHRGSRASSRKSSRASDASDLSELGSASAWLFPNLPLLLLSGATGTHEDLQPPALTVSRPSPTTEQPSAASSSGSDSHVTVRLIFFIRTSRNNDEIIFGIIRIISKRSLRIACWTGSHIGRNSSVSKCNSYKITLF